MQACSEGAAAHTPLPAAAPVLPSLRTLSHWHSNMAYHSYGALPCAFTLYLLRVKSTRLTYTFFL